MEQPKPTTLIHLSGGLDSTFVLWQHLTQNTNDHVLVHHVLLQHLIENRIDVERQAVNSILAELRAMKLTNFTYYESWFAYGTLPRITIKDIQIVAVFSSIILKTPQFASITTIKLPWHFGEVHNEEIRKGYRVRNMLSALEAPEIKFDFPIENLTRSDLYNQLPENIRKYVRSCRKPHINGGNPCRACATCLEYINQGLEPL